MNIFKENKVLSHLETLNKYLSGEEYPPILVELDLTNKCTSDCPWCFGFLDRKLKTFSLFEQGSDPVERENSTTTGIKTLISNLALMGVKAITFTGGGDPTCHKGLFEFLEHAHNLGMKLGLITNGVIDVKAALPYCEWIRFSVDGATQETYGYMHGKPQHFKRVVENISELCRVKKNMGLKTTVGVGFLTGAPSKNEIVEFVKLWKDVGGLDYIQYRPLLDKYGEKWFTDNADTLDLIREAKDFDKRVTYAEPKYHALVEGKTGKTKKCHGTFLETAIAADGKVYICCHMKGKPEYAIGDLYKESIFQIWKRHLSKRDFDVNSDCPSFCRHYGTNKLIEDEILSTRDHRFFI